MKAKEKHLPVIPNQALPLSSDAILLSNSEGHYFVKLGTILYCKSDNAYTTFHLTNKQEIVVSQNLKVFELKLCKRGFIRIHQSSLINSLHLVVVLKKQGGYLAQMSNGAMLNVARQKKVEIINILKRFSIS